jgi:hypothetical protein
MEVVHRFRVRARRGRSHASGLILFLFFVILVSYFVLVQLYERLLAKTQHVKVWVSFAQFETSLGTPEAEEMARDVFARGDKTAKMAGDKQQRLALLEAWLQFEHAIGDETLIKQVGVSVRDASGLFFLVFTYMRHPSGALQDANQDEAAAAAA